MGKLSLVLAEAALETIPAKIAGHPQVRKDCERRGKLPSQLLLDSSLHYAAMQGLEHGDRRGRPDIVHRCLLIALDSIANRLGMMDVYVHTFHDEVIYINPETRLPRTYDRFKGLMVDLFAKRRIEELLRVEKKELHQLIQEINPSSVYIAEEGGERVGKMQLVEMLKNERNPCFVIGAFPHGNFLRKIEGRRISLSDFMLEAQTVVATIIFCFELSQGV